VREGEAVSVPVVQHGHGGLWHDAHKLAVASLLMIGAFVAWMLLLMPVGWGLQAALDLDDTQVLYEAGAWGWLAFVLMAAASAVPPTIGIVLGLRARRLGERRLAAVGVASNALLVVVFVLAPLLAALLG
jgi:hypothetical protein